jgi:hypothetical protein
MVARLADKIRQSDDMISEIIDVPEWDVKLSIRSMTGNQRANMQTEWADNESMQTASMLYKSIIQICCFDPDTGEQVFTEDDIEWLFDEKQAGIIEQVGTECLRVSGLSGNAVDEAGKDS